MNTQNKLISKMSEINIINLILKNDPYKINQLYYQVQLVLLYYFLIYLFRASA